MLLPVHLRRPYYALLPRTLRCTRDFGSMLLVPVIIGAEFLDW